MPASDGAEPVNGSSSFSDYRRSVEQMVANDVAFEPLARAIDESCLLAPDQKAALWLLAWSLTGPDTARAKRLEEGR